MTNGDGVATNLLQVSHNSRALYAQSHYGSGTDFVFTDDPSGCLITMLSWAQVLPSSDLNLVERISVISMSVGCGPSSDPKKIMDDSGLMVQLVGSRYHMGHIISKCVFLLFSAGEVDDDDDALEYGAYFFGCNRSKRFHQWARDLDLVERKRLSKIPTSSLTRDEWRTLAGLGGRM